MNLLKHIRRIERAAYPPEYRQLQHVGLVDYCEAKNMADLIVLTGPNWYFLAVKSTREIVDFAADGRIGFAELLLVLNTLRQQMPEGVITGDFRHSTSYPLLLVAQRRGHIQILSDNVWQWCNEQFHEVELLIA